MFVIERKRNETKQRESKKVAEVYGTEDRPFDHGDIVGDFAWRRTHKPRRENAGLVKALVAEAMGVEAATLKVRYDRHCGCSMCPCSPGYTVTAERPTRHKLLIWVKWED